MGLYDDDSAEIVRIGDHKVTGPYQGDPRLGTHNVFEAAVYVGLYHIICFAVSLEGTFALCSSFPAPAQRLARLHSFRLPSSTTRPMHLTSCEPGAARSKDRPDRVLSFA